MHAILIESPQTVESSPLRRIEHHAQHVAEFMRKRVFVGTPHFDSAQQFESVSLADALPTATQLVELRSPFLLREKYCQKLLESLCIARALSQRAQFRRIGY